MGSIGSTHPPALAQLDALPDADVVRIDAPAMARDRAETAGGEVTANDHRATPPPVATEATAVWLTAGASAGLTGAGCTATPEGFRAG